jgi:hypothetical protein
MDRWYMVFDKPPCNNMEMPLYFLRKLWVDFIMGLLYFDISERGCVEKETTMAVEGTWKGGVNFHQELTPYLDSTGPENQKRLVGPEFNVSWAGR